MYRTILIATDGNAASRRAAVHGVELAAALDASVHVLSVAKNVETRDQLRADPESEAMDAIEHVEHEATARGVDVETSVRTGDPCEEILAAADEVRADAIVVGSSVPWGLDRLLHGSVAKYVFENATVPVTIVNETAAERLATPADAAYTFRCPACEGTLPASEPTRTAILERGCIMCGTDVTESAFDAARPEVTFR